MGYLADITKMHEEIQKKIFLMLPEKWDSLYLYASIIEKINNIQTGEMFFYYFPKGILRKKAINVYEVPSKFSIDENQYFRLADSLYDSIKKLRNIQIENGEESWSNITIAIEGLKYKAIYNYEDLNDSEFDSSQRRIIWTYNYLNLPYESFNKKEREIIDSYKRKARLKEKNYEQGLYTKPTNKKLENVRTLEKKYEFVTEEKIEEMEFVNSHIPKSQILK